MEATMQQQDILRTVRSYARYHWSQMRQMGINIELEELEGEFGEVYAKAMRSFKKSKAVEFGTYLHRALENKVKNLKREAAKSWRYRVVSLDEDTMGEELATDGFEADMETAEEIESAGAKLTGVRRLVFDELRHPSEEVQERIQQLNIQGARGATVKAICDVHNLHRGEVYNALKKIKFLH